jgi:hypothetical protein
MMVSEIEIFMNKKITHLILNLWIATVIALVIL